MSKRELTYQGRERGVAPGPNPCGMRPVLHITEAVGEHRLALVR